MYILQARKFGLTLVDLFYDSGAVTSIKMTLNNRRILLGRSSLLHQPNYLRYIKNNIFATTLREVKVHRKIPFILARCKYFLQYNVSQDLDQLAEQDCLLGERSHPHLLLGGQRNFLSIFKDGTTIMQRIQVPRYGKALFHFLRNLVSQICRFSEILVSL